MRRASRWVGILMLTAFFTCFGQGRSSHWEYLATDKQGHHYYLDRRRLKKVGPDRFELYLRRDKLVAHYLLDADQKTLTILGRGARPPDDIQPNSIGEVLMTVITDDDRKSSRRESTESPPPSED